VKYTVYALTLLQTF